MENKKFYFIIFIAVAAVLLLIAMRDFITPILTGLILAFLFYPVFNFLSKKIKNDSAAGIITIIVAIIIILIPVIILSWMLTLQAIDLYNYLMTTDFISLVKNYITDPAVLDRVSVLTEKMQQNHIFEKLFSYIFKGTFSVVTALTKFFINIFITFVVMFFALVNRGKFIEYLVSFLPVSKNNQKKFISKSKSMIKALVYGQVPISIIQGTIGSVGFYIFGIPDPLFWGFVMAILSFIPIIGAFLVWIPASIYLFIARGIFEGAGLFLYGAVIISLSDNFLRMFIMKKLDRIHPLITLLGVLFGIPLFGIMGIVIGPIILALFFTSLQIIKHNKKD